MRRLFPFLTAILLAGSALTASAAPPVRTSRVIVSSTLNDTLQVFDASTLAETQPPLPSRGGAPVRMFVHSIAQHPYLFAADHGVEGALGVFDLAGDLVTEMPASPYPSAPGSVGVTAAPVVVDGGAREMVFVTNTWQALGGCSLPNGSVSAFDATGLGTPFQAVVPLGNTDVHGAIPYAVATDGNRAFVSTNCGNTLDTISLTGSGQLGPSPVDEGARATGASPDGVMFDPIDGLIYVANIGGNSLSVFDATSSAALTTVPLAGAGPIDLALADTSNGHHFVLASDGADDSISVVDRDAIAACVSAHALTCDAEVARPDTGVKGGAPEGVAFDPTSGRIFSINKTIGAPSLSVMQLDDSRESPSVTRVATIPLELAGSGTPVPDLIAFDVVVQTR